MCGIVGYIGNKHAKPYLIDGLKRLEYRGYDSAGIAVISVGGKITIDKKAGKISILAAQMNNLSGHCGIGHTRWATHGKPCDKNSHPHKSGKFAVVHNGIIENFLELKVQLVNAGVKFKSETDTEVIAQLLNYYYEGDFLGTVRKAVDMLAGSYALAVICEDSPEEIVVAKQHSPLIIGYGNEENYIASDIPAILPYTDMMYTMQDNEFAIVKKDSVRFFDWNLDSTERTPSKVDMKSDSIELGCYESYMQKEINEIPEAIGNTVENYLNTDITKFKKALEKIDSVIVVACGTAYHSGVVAKCVIEKLARISVRCEIASEFRYENPIVDEKVLTIAISQSGETADTLAAAKLAKQRNSTLVAITNSSHSALTSMADIVFPTIAGVEISVAATKSYNSQLAVLYMIAFTIAEVKCGTNVSHYIEELKRIPEKARQLMNDADIAIALSQEYSKKQSIFFIGRNLDYAVSLEGSLKLKEISYIHSEGYAAGEMKHGTLALIDKNSLVVVLITQKELAEKTFNALHEVAARDAHVVIVTMFEQYSINNDQIFSYVIPQTDELFTPLLSVIPLQGFAYYMARSRGCDPDKPRNLAKSVTVE